MSDELTDHELQSLRNMGNEAERAADEITHLRAALAAAQPPAAMPVPEPMTRFCPGCGGVGDVPAKLRDCCPDGGKARVIPAALAKNCRDLFRLALDAAAQPVPATGAQPQK